MLDVRSRRSGKNIPIVKPKVSRIRRLLKDDKALAAIREMAETGASLSTIDARMKFPPNTMSKLLAKGKEAKESKDPYHKFYIQFRSWAAEANHIAEELLLKKSPEKWLDRSSTSKVIQSEEDKQLALEAPSNPQGNLPANNANPDTLIQALEILRAQGEDLNELVDKKAISIGEPDEDD